MKIFKVDSPFMLNMGKATDFIVVNLFFIITCLPIVTIGAAMSALYSVSFRLSEDEENYNFKQYWQSFKLNFKESTKAWLILLIAITMLSVDFNILQGVDSNLGKFFMYAILLCDVVVLITIMYVFPYIARFKNSTRRSIMNALIIGIANFPYTVLLAVIMLAGVLFVVKFSVIGKVLAFFCGFALMAYLSSMIFSKVFKKYEGQK